MYDIKEIDLLLREQVSPAFVDNLSEDDYNNLVGIIFTLTDECFVAGYKKGYSRASATYCIHYREDE